MQVRTPTAEEDSRTDTITVELRPRGVARLSVRRTGVGDSASVLRARYQREGDRKRQLEAEWSQFFPGAKLISVTASDLSDNQARPVINYVIDLPDAYTTKADGSIELRVSFNPREWTQTQFASLTARKTDMLLPAPFMHTTTWTLKLKAGQRLAKPPKPLKSESEFASLEIQATQKGATISVRRVFKLLGA